MTDLWLPALFACFVWWFGTGAVLFADRLPESAHRTAMRAATAVAGVGLYAIWDGAGERTLAAALLAFAGAVAIWGWHELSFLTGRLTGPRRTPCPPGATGWRRFVYATETVIHHEIAIAATGVALAVWLWEAANPVALWTYATLWGMRLSAKFNLFLGAPNVAEEFLPDRMAYLDSYFARRPINALFPLSVTAGTLATGWLAMRALEAGSGFEAAAFAATAALMGLGTLEHWFLVLPWREAALWRWWLRARERRARRIRGDVVGAGEDERGRAMRAPA